MDMNFSRLQSNFVKMRSALKYEDLETVDRLYNFNVTSYQMSEEYLTLSQADRIDKRIEDFAKQVATRGWKVVGSNVVMA